MAAQLSAALAKRLAAYSATAGVTLAAAPAATGQIAYHDYVPDVVSGSTLDALDFDDDGVVDFFLREYTHTSGLRRGRSYGVTFYVPDGGNAPNGLLGYDGPFFSDPDRGGLSRFQAGDTIGPVSPPQGFYRTARAIYYTYASSSWFYPFANEMGFAGFRFVAGDGQLHYGWMRLRGEGVSITVFTYGYELTPETPIRSGAKTVLAEGSVNQTVIPPDGGILVYTFTLTSNTDDPLPLDLWVETEGPATYTQRLGSGTLPPRAIVTRTVSIPVSANTPQGTYEVKFKVGNLAAGEFLSFERFFITKAVPLTGVIAGAPAAPFAAAPVSGDLFAGSEASSPAAPVTHALSAPVPNPSTGRAAFMLEVAEAQVVRVEVMDALGRRVATLHDGTLAAGSAHRFVLDGSSLPSGVYAVRAVGETFSDVRILTLTR
jgi:hypothetical protein